MTTPPTSAPDRRDKHTVNGYSVPDAILVVLHTIAGIVADAVESVFTFVAGGAAVGAAVYCAWAARADEPDYGYAGRPRHRVRRHLRRRFVASRPAGRRLISRAQ